MTDVGFKKNSVDICMYVMYICLYVFEDFSRLRALTGPKVVPDGMVLDNTLLRHVFSAVMFLERACQVIAVPIGLTLWSGQWTSFTLSNLKCNYH